jgi:hypothetical protein
MSNSNTNSSATNGLVWMVDEAESYASDDIVSYAFDGTSHYRKVLRKGVESTFRLVFEDSKWGRLPNYIRVS